MTVTYSIAPAADCPPETLYRLLWVRVRVFIVEQGAAYDDLDGRDIEPGAELLWASLDGDVVSTARIVQEPDGLRIGRVATDPRARGRGIAGELLRRAVDRCLERDPRADIMLGAQAHLADWYARFGFVTDGPGFVEDGIPHVPMRRAAAA